MDDIEQAVVPGLDSGGIAPQGNGPAVVAPYIHHQCFSLLGEGGGNLGGEGRDVQIGIGIEGGQQLDAAALHQPGEIRTAEIGVDNVQVDEHHVFALALEIQRQVDAQIGLSTAIVAGDNGEVGEQVCHMVPSLGT